MSGSKISILIVVVCGALGLAAAIPARQENAAAKSPGIRKDVNLVSVYFTVRDSKHRLITDLSREQFRVFDGGQEQSIGFFAHHSDVPLNLGVYLDTGTGMATTLNAEADGANQFLRHVVRTNDLAFVVSYANQVDIVQEPTDNLEFLQTGVESIRRNARGGATTGRPTARWPASGPFPGPGTGPNIADLRVARLYDALSSIVPRLLGREVGRKAVVIVALADDAKSESTLEDALRTLEENDVIAYVLQVSDGPRDSCDVLHVYRGGQLRKLAEETGGRVVEVRGMNRMAAALDEIAEELHNQYSLGFTPLNQKWDNQFRRIEIKVQGARYRVQARKGYYATKPQPLE